MSKDIHSKEALMETAVSGEEFCEGCYLPRVPFCSVCGVDMRKQIENLQEENARLSEKLEKLKPSMSDIMYHDSP